MNAGTCAWPEGLVFRPERRHGAFAGWATAHVTPFRARCINSCPLNVPTLETSAAAGALQLGILQVNCTASELPRGKMCPIWNELNAWLLLTQGALHPELSETKSALTAKPLSPAW